MANLTMVMDMKMERRPRKQKKGRRNKFLCLCVSSFHCWRIKIWEEVVMESSG